MKRTVLTLSTLMMLTSLTACGRSALPTSAMMPMASLQAQSMNQQPQELVVRFKTGMNRATLNEFHAKYGTRTVKVLPQINAHVLVMHESIGVQVTQVARYMQQDPMVAYVEVNGRVDLNPVITAKPIF
jgi:predicted small lipoprotein YifL